MVTRGGKGRGWGRSPLLVAVATVGTAAILIITVGPLMSRVEQAPYSVELSEGSIELRAYSPMVIAQVRTSGSRSTAISDGFRMIAGYIFGANASRRKIEMTAPVMQERAGVDGKAAEGDWFVRFVMPRQWTLATLPKPSDPRVTLAAQPAATFATIRFSGWAGRRSVETETQRLSAFIAKRNLDPIGAPVYAFFNPPWTLPFFRRNEIMIEVRAS